jgi:hypothetical protein
MKVIYGIYEGYISDKTPIDTWKSREWGVKAGDTRVINDILFYADAVHGGDKFWNRPTVVWKPHIKQNEYI